MTDPDTEAKNSDIAADSDTRCGESVERSTANAASRDKVLAASRILDAVLPGELQVALGRLIGDEPIGTLGDWVTEVRRRTGGGAIAVDDLCHVDGETAHWAEMNGETYHFRCFYDAVVLAAHVDQPVEIRTESPDGTVIEGQAVGAVDLTVSPENAVFSFGVAEAVDAPRGRAPRLGDVYAAVCPYVRAFPSVDAYERWAAEAPAVTVVMPLADATAVAAALVD